MNTKINNQLKNEIDNFIEVIHTGIRGEYEQGWSYRDIDEDKKTLQEFICNILKYQKK